MRPRHRLFVRCTIPTTPALQGLRARFAGIACSSSKAGWRVDPGYYPPVLPTRYTHPATRLGPVDQHGLRPAHAPRTGRGTPGTCTYDTFRLAVGEPRGVEYRGILRVLTVFSTGLVLDVLHLIMTETGVLGTGSSEACGRSILRLILRSILRLF